MQQNESLKFICEDVYLSVKNKDTVFTKSIDTEILQIPIAHGEGNYFADDDTLKELEDNEQIVFQYSSQDNKIDKIYNPNGSLLNIAGIVNKRKNVLGMMPHPERSCDPILRKTDGQKIFKSIAENIFN
jgi:phosphoribosylformylglycinamidine synthase